MAPVAVVLGYGLAVGDNFLKAFGKAGYQVAIVARNVERLKQVAAACNEAGFHVFPYSGDLAKPETVGDLIDQITKVLGGLDSVVYNSTV